MSFFVNSKNEETDLGNNHMKFYDDDDNETKFGDKTQYLRIYNNKETDVVNNQEVTNTTSSDQTKVGYKIEYTSLSSSNTQ